MLTTEKMHCTLSILYHVLFWTPKNIPKTYHVTEKAKISVFLKVVMEHRRGGSIFWHFDLQNKITEQFYLKGRIIISKIFWKIILFSINFYYFGMCFRHWPLIYRKDKFQLQDERILNKISHNAKFLQSFTYDLLGRK